MNNDNVKAHRCLGRQFGCGIRYLNNRYYKGWYLMRYEFDCEWYSHHYSPVARINYCPFCGKELEEVSQDVQ